MEARLHVVLIYGGRSSEHEVSAVSARSILQAMNDRRYRVTLVRIDRQGNWTRVTDLRSTPGGGLTSMATDTLVCLAPGGRLVGKDGSTLDLPHVDVAFPVLHGPNGEDGTIQGLLQLYDIPCVGASVLGSAIGMDKDVMKRLLREAGIPTPDFRVVCREDANKAGFAECMAMLGTPLFVKPANTGSSVGISKVKDEISYQRALEDAFSFDTKVLIETAITGRELECAVIGTSPLRVSVCGEIVTRHEFYTYEAKYEDETATDLIIPAEIPSEVATRMQELARRTYRALCCEGMARIDFFLEQDGSLLVNEINTIPGFTSGSMFPLLWAHSGLGLPDLVDVLVQDAITRQLRTRAFKRAR